MKHIATEFVSVAVVPAQMAHLECCNVLLWQRTSLFPFVNFGEHQTERHLQSKMTSAHWPILNMYSSNEPGNYLGALKGPT